jgi:hypothetical protein
MEGDIIMSEPEVAYCDDYEALKASGAIYSATVQVETKVVAATGDGRGSNLGRAGRDGLTR